MDAFIITFILIGLIVYGLERNRRHQDAPRPRLAGSTDVVDRDGQRVLADLNAAVDR
jgi:hypothetical protein